MNFISRSILMKLLVVCGAGTALFLAVIIASLWLTPDFTVRLALIAIAGGVAFAALVIAVNKVILAPIKDLVSALDRLDKCNFSTPIRNTSTDEIGEIARSAENIRTHIGKIIADVGQSATEISASLHSLSSSASQAVQRSHEQSEEALSMATVVEIMTFNIDSIADQAGQVQTIAVEADDLSGRGSAVIHSAVSEIEKIADSVNSSSQAVQTLEQQSDKIGAIVKVIMDIADQTNLLALNAAIEAARAGEQGRGFAVVADEVRKLAERTTASTVEIRDVIQNIQTQTSGAVNAMTAGVAQVQAGAALAKEAGESINNIKSSAQQVVQAVSEISESLRQQSSSNSENAHKVEKIAQLAQENSVSIDEIANTATHLASMTNMLQTAVAAFKT